MTAKNLFDDLSQKFSELLANSPARDIEKNAKALMSSAFDKLDRRLAEQGVPGPTITVTGLGHQLWHSFPMVVQLTKAMLGPL